jgi:hypothetical protein
MMFFYFKKLILKSTHQNDLETLKKINFFKNMDWSAFPSTTIHATAQLLFLLREASFELGLWLKL